MATRDDSKAPAVAIVGGGALLAWLLLRGGSGFGLGGGGGGAGLEAPGDGATVPAAGAALPPCRVRIRASAIELNGAPSDLAATVVACRATGGAELTATGDAIVGLITRTVQALEASGVRVALSPELWELLQGTRKGA